MDKTVQQKREALGFLMFLLFLSEKHIRKEYKKYMYQNPIRKLDSASAARLKNYVYDILGCCMKVHQELGCWLNEYMYQDALDIALLHRGIEHQKEFHFTTTFENEKLNHEHQVDFRVRENVFIECKAATSLCTEHRQQLWNYLRLTKTPIGILYNFAPTIDQCEKYYYNSKDDYLYLF